MILQPELCIVIPSIYAVSNVLRLLWPTFLVQLTQLPGLPAGAAGTAGAELPGGAGIHPALPAPS